MSKADFELVKKVSNVLKGMQTLDELVGEPPQVHLSDKALARWHELEKLHNDFYEMSLNDRLKYSELNSDANRSTK